MRRSFSPEFIEICMETPWWCRGNNPTSVTYFCLKSVNLYLKDLQNIEIILLSSLSNTVEQIRPVNGLTRLVRLVRSVQVLKQWFTSRTGRGTMVTCISLVRQHFNLHSTTRTTRTGRTGRETMAVTNRTVGEPYRYLHTNDNGALGGPKGRPAKPHRHHGKEKETHCLISYQEGLGTSL